METTKIYNVYFYDEMDDSNNENRYYRKEENAEKKYKQLCKKYKVKPSFCFTDQNGVTIWYTEIYIED